MNKKIIDLLQEKNNKLDSFLKDVKNVNYIVPTVKQAKEETDWALNVFKNMPPDASNRLNETKLSNIFGQDLSIWKNALPKLDVDPNFTTTSGSGASGTASQVVFNEILNINGVSGSSQHLDINKWARLSIDEYMKIQSRQNKVQEIENTLKKIKDSLATEFRDANSTYIKADAEVIYPKDAANSMRNVLNHFEGNLIELARFHPGENIKNSDKWQFIANRLATGGNNGNEYALLSLKGRDQRQIQVDLTDITKNTSTNPLEKLRIVHAQWLDHLYTSLKFIDFTGK